MAITFYTQSKKQYASIYIRIREGGNPNNKGIDAKAKTNFKIECERFEKGEILKYKILQKDNHIVKSEKDTKNDALIEVKRHLDALERDIQRKLNNRKDYEVINTQWLKNALKTENTDVYLTDYFLNYLEIKKGHLKPRTIKKLNTFRNRLLKYEKDNDRIYIAEVNVNTRDNVMLWMGKNGYDHNTSVKTISVIKQICEFAKERGKVTHPKLKNITKGLKYKKSPHVYLTFDEIDKIIEVNLTNAREDIARDWLIISCFTAQRVGDYLKFNKKNIVTVKDIISLRIKQSKIEKSKPVYVPLNSIVLKILKKYKGDFPPSFSDNENSNEVIYNRLVKIVCEKAKLNDKVKIKLRKTKERNSEIKTVPKFKAVSSHIGRRSFATNYYGKIPTALLIGVTNHSSEKQFLEYVGEKETDNVVDLNKFFKKIEKKRNKKKLKSNKLNIV